MFKKIGFVYDLKDEYLKNFKREIICKSKISLKELTAEFDSQETIKEVAEALVGAGYEVEKIGNVFNLLEKIFQGKKWDIVFNISEGLRGRNRESQVPLLLEMYNIPYVGSDSLTMGLTLDKSAAKKIVSYHGILTPKFVQIKSLSEIKFLEKKVANLKFPLFIKLCYEGSSKGLTKKSFIKNLSELRKRTEFLLKKYVQPVVIEEFISGKEFTVVVIGNKFSKKYPIEALSPVQIVINNSEYLGNEFYTFRRVYNNETSYICPVHGKEILIEKLKRIAEIVYEILELRDFGRIDFRVDDEDKIYFLECNPLPHLGKIDLFPLVAESMGLNYEQLIVKILNIAIDRYKNLEKSLYG